MISGYYTLWSVSQSEDPLPHSVLVGIVKRAFYGYNHSIHSFMIIPGHASLIQ
jgi:hypothetical protein